MSGRPLWLQAVLAIGLLAVVALVVFGVQTILMSHGSHSTGVTTRVVTTAP